MAKPVSPSLSLFILLLAGLAIAGWLYGIHWKRTASGDLFTNDERLMIRLQDQIQSLTKENEDLHSKLNSLTGQPEADPAQEVPLTTEISPAPLLPSPPQKIETH